jgi:hypothetical protein
MCYRACRKYKQNGRSQLRQFFLTFLELLHSPYISLQLLNFATKTIFLFLNCFPPFLYKKDSPPPGFLLAVTQNMAIGLRPLTPWVRKTKKYP